MNRYFTGKSGPVTIGPNSTTYTAKDLCGTKFSLTGLVAYKGGGGILQTINISDLNAQSAAGTLIFFVQNPTNTTFTNNSALDIHDSDLPYAFQVAVAATDYVALADNSLATIKPNVAFKLNDTSVLYGCFMCSGTPTYTTAANLKISAFTI